MNGEPRAGQAVSSGAAWFSLLASSGTLICCVLPAVLVAVGAGATLASLVTRFPQLVWLSEHKAAVFAVAGVALAAGGVAQWRARGLPCPVDPVARSMCLRSRRISSVVYAFAVLAFLVGGTFAFLLPLFGSG